MSAGLFSAPTETLRFRTLELRATASCDDAAFVRLSLRAALAGGADPKSIQVYSVGPTRGGWTSHSWRVWWAPPSRWRGDMTGPDGQTDVSVVRDDTALVYYSMQRLMFTNEQVAPDPRWKVAPAPTGIVELPTIANRHAVFPLLHPPLPESEWVFATVAAPEVYEGRVTRHVRATRRAYAALDDERKASGYWPGVDEYECLVDDALQILLRFTAIADGVPVATVSVDDVHVDAQFPTDIFDFVPPPQTRIAFVARST